MPDYIKRGIWLHRVASRIENEAVAELLSVYADHMIDRARSEHRPVCMKTLKAQMAGDVTDQFA